MEKNTELLGNLKPGDRFKDEGKVHTVVDRDGGLIVAYDGKDHLYWSYDYEVEVLEPLPMCEEHTYVVIGESGEYSFYSMWIDSVFTNEELAEARVTFLNETAKNRKSTDRPEYHYSTFKTNIPDGGA